MPSSLTHTSRSALSLADFTNAGMIIPHLRGRDPASVIQELSYAMERERRVPDVLPFYHAVLNREFLVGTDMEPGLALPHARLPGLKELAFAVGRSDEPVLWGARSARSVRLVFLFAVPATDSAQYLLLISGLARLTKNEVLMHKLHTAQDTFQILEVLQQIKLRSPSNADSKKALA